MQFSVFTPLSSTEESKRQRAKERLYVLCQLAGWGSFLGFQLLVIRLFAPDGTYTMAGGVQTVALGLLLTHYSRRLIHRWGWKELSWARLLWRLPLMAMAISLAWSAIGYGLYYGLLQTPWPDKVKPAAAVTISILNGSFMLIGWYCIYFFFHLFDRYNRLEIERLKMVAAVKETELRALKSQVNPHFIFNALNSVRALIDEDPSRARKAVTELANLLRYSLKTVQLEVVPFEDELSVANDYLALEQVRHEERLRLRVEIQPGALRQPVPPMLLQTLVENAVKYGISPLAAGGEIRIAARVRDGGLELQVFNPGCLADPAPSSPVTPSTGIGLRNTADRLRLLCGDRAQLSLRQYNPDTVVAEAFVPGSHPETPAPGDVRGNDRPRTQPIPSAR
jgi:signal transduction histidine kinase